MREVLSGPCESTSALLGIDCGEPSIGLYVGACVHEHVMERRLCAGHASRDSLWCRVCFQLDGAKMHTWDVTLTPVAQAVARTAMPGQVTP